jgi:MFS family permease
MPGGHADGILTTESPRRDSSAGTEILLTIVLGAMLVPLNSTMIAVALPRLIADFGSELSSAGWLVTGYLIAMASLQPVAGKLGDRLGRRMLVLAGLGWFGLSSLGAGLAPNLPLLIAFRIQQAVAGAVIFPNGIALLRATAPPGRLGRRLGLVMGALPLAAAVGPLVAGLLLTFARLESDLPRQPATGRGSSRPWLAITTAHAPDTRDWSVRRPRRSVSLNVPLRRRVDA